MPAATPRAEEPAVTRASWTAAADAAPPVAEPAYRTATAPAHGTAQSNVYTRALRTTLPIDRNIPLPS